jgi:hypothetical protein
VAQPEALCNSERENTSAAKCDHLDWDEIVIAMMIYGHDDNRNDRSHGDEMKVMMPLVIVDPSGAGREGDCQGQ